MRFIGKYRVKHNGVIIPAGIPATIRAEDAEELKRHGDVLDDLTPAPNNVQNPPKRTGRPKKKEALNGQHNETSTEDEGARHGDS